jgi:sialate O-acetylesterase
MPLRTCTFHLLALCLLLTRASEPAIAQIRLFGLFTDHTVLQRDVPVPLWGTARPGERITVAGVGKSLTTKADSQGGWSVVLPAQPARPPFSLSVVGRESGTVVLRDLVYGDVWLCSGQSNMQMRVREADNFATERTSATDALIRHISLPNKTSLMPLDTLPGGTWQSASPETVGDFSAVGYFFAQHLRATALQPGKVPVGLLNASWGGTRLECWSSAAAMGYKTPTDANAYHATEAARRRAEVATYHPNVPTTDPGFVGGNALYAAPDLDDSGWKKARLPSWLWGEGKEDFDGIFWLRKTIDVPADMANSAVTLSLGRASDALLVWVNGKPVEANARITTDARRYSLPAGLLRAGRNVITLRIHDEGASTGITENGGSDERLELRTPCARLALSGEWLYTLAAFQYKPDEQWDSAPSLVYNALIAPILRFPVRGILWYQGEANSWPPVGLSAYSQQLINLATDWRRAWGNVPFLIVQLPVFGATQPNPNKASNWALLREAQATAARMLPNAATITTLDVGNPTDIHPTNKQPVGQRLALAARALAYQQAIDYQSPTFDKLVIEGATARLTFSHTAGGLRANDPYGYVKGFVVAGVDGQFHWAKAQLEGDAVVVSSPHVPKPVAVRYAWANSPVDANLVGGTGLPVGTFRTDTWLIRF